MRREHAGVSGWLPAGGTRTVTFQRGSTEFHLIMTLLTAGLWLPVWACCRRTVRITSR